MKTMVLGLLSFSLALPLLAMPLPGTWESLNGDFDTGSWAEVLTGGTAGALGNEFQAGGEGYQLEGALLSVSEQVETGSDSVTTTATYDGGVLTLANDESVAWFDSADPSTAFTVNLVSLQVTTRTFTNPMGQPTGDIEFTLRAEGVAADDSGIEVAFDATYAGTPGLDMSAEPAVLFDALAGATVTVTQPVVLPTLVDVDIKPGSDANPVNLTSKGVIPVAIMGSADVDVSQIDPATIRLAGVAPVRWSVSDLGLETEEAILPGDGFADLKLKFKTAQLAAVLGDVARNEKVTLTLTAQLFDGTMVEGSDTIRVLKSNRKPPKPQKPHGKK